MSVELPKDAKGREIPLDTVALFNCVGNGKYQGLRTFYVSCLGCGARTDLEYAEEFAADLWNERVSYVD